jgi:methylase of polypeptide subunit release factors
MTPRRASEQLVSAALDHVGSSEALVVDVGTGVGAIAVAIATAAPNVRVFATDTSPRAVVLARENVRRHSLSDRVTVYRGDLLDPVPGSIDLVVANLPIFLPPTPGAIPSSPRSPPTPSSPPATASSHTAVCSRPAASGWMTKRP